MTIQLSILIAVVVSHLLVFAGLVPTTVAWGGRFSDPARAKRMELVSVVTLIGA